MEWLSLCYNKDTSKVYDNFSFIICVLNEVKSFKPRSNERGVFYINILFAKYTPMGYNTLTGITDKPQ